MNKIDSEPKLQDHLELIREASRESGSTIVTAAVSVGEDDGAHKIVLLDFDPFLSLLRQCRPRVIYVQADEFQSKENLHALLDIETIDKDVVAESAPFKTLVKRWAKFDGEVDFYAASFMIDGVLHAVLTKTTWYEEFEVAAKELAYSLGEQQFRAAENKQKAERARLSTLAKQLNEHPVFHTARAPEKLKYLARKLFPDADDAEIRIIVDEAIKENWLQESGYYAAGSD